MASDCRIGPSNDADNVVWAKNVITGKIIPIVRPPEPCGNSKFVVS